MSKDKVLDIKEYKVGLRTMELRQEDDAFGKSFQFIVNGVPIFAKGSNWIPADSFLTRFSDERLEKLIADAAASHQNMLRVWGGGLYEEERFYDLCDKYGMLVWQDFVFSCSIYPLDEADFHENVRIEVDENIKRLRHRASLALWCGNNEMEWGWESWGWQKHPMEDQLPVLVEQFPELGFLLDLSGNAIYSRIGKTSRPPTINSSIIPFLNGLQLSILIPLIGQVLLHPIHLSRMPTARSRAMPIIGTFGTGVNRSQPIVEPFLAS